eukprot:2275433-Amphidinium_carterae.1
MDSAFCSTVTRCGTSKLKRLLTTVTRRLAPSCTHLLSCKGCVCSPKPCSPKQSSERVLQQG